MLAGQEYRYVCRIGCGGVPMRVYSQDDGSDTTWQSREGLFGDADRDRVSKQYGQTLAHYVWVAGHWLADWGAGGGWASYQDRFGVGVGDLYFPAAAQAWAEYLGRMMGYWTMAVEKGMFLFMRSVFKRHRRSESQVKNQDKPKHPHFKACLDACAEPRTELMKDAMTSMSRVLSKCAGLPGTSQTACISGFVYNLHIMLNECRECCLWLYSRLSWAVQKAI